MVGRLAWLVVPVILLSGALGAPYLADTVPFEVVQREHFDAIAVVRDAGATSDAPLVLRVELAGDAADFDLGRAAAWLAEHANVVLVEDAGGAPLFLTRGDLAATSGRATLGATVREGMAVEVRDDDVAACVVAHEVLHFLGLKHVATPTNIMYAHCKGSQLDRAVLEPWQLARVASIARVSATTPTGVETWAIRS